MIKANVHKKVPFSWTDFIRWEILFITKLANKKTKPIKYTTYKTDVTKMGLVFPISNFFINKISKGRKSICGLATAIYLMTILELFDIECTPNIGKKSACNFEVSSIKNFPLIQK